MIIWEWLGHIDIIFSLLTVVFSGYAAFRLWQDRKKSWRVVVKKGEDILLSRAINPDTASKLEKSNFELDVFLKGIISPFAWLKTDLNTALAIGLITIDSHKRLYTVNLSKNPKHDTRSQWQVIVQKGGEILLVRSISPRKARELHDDLTDLGIYLKDVASPFERIGVDILSEGQEIGLLKIDDALQQYIIDLDKNPNNN